MSTCNYNGCNRAGIEGRRGPDSYDIMPALTGETDDQILDHLAIAAFRKSHLSLRDGDWMYIAQAGEASSFKVGTHGFGGYCFAFRWAN